MIEIVKLGYEELNIDTMFSSFYQSYSNDISSVYELLYEKEKVKEKMKPYLSYYYLKGPFLHEPINQNDFIYSPTVYAENSSYKVVKIPQKELETILVKNKIGNYLTSNIIQDKEFDVLFKELYPALVERVKKEFFALKLGLKVFILSDNRVVVCQVNTVGKVIGTLKDNDDFKGLIKILYNYFVFRNKDVETVYLKDEELKNSKQIFVRNNY